MTTELIPETIPGVPCKGSAASQALRDARGREAATRATLRAEALKAHALAQRHEMGNAEKTVEELLDDRAIESMSGEWLARKGRAIIQEIEDAEEMREHGEEDDDLDPEPATWGALKDLALALFSQADALKNLHITEKNALTHP